jgi:hypothetical protein
MIQDQEFFKKLMFNQIDHKQLFDEIYFDSLKGFKYIGKDPNAIFQFYRNELLLKGFSAKLESLFNLPDLDEK